MPKLIQIFKFMLIVTCWLFIVFTQTLSPINQLLIEAIANGSKAYPCEGHDCGCKNELQCMTNCCCFPEKVVIEKSCCEKSEEPEEVKQVFGFILKAIDCNGGASYFYISGTPVLSDEAFEPHVINLKKSCFASDSKTVYSFVILPKLPKELDKVPIS